MDEEVDLSEYMEWTAKDCYEADQQIKALYNRVMKLQGKLDKLSSGSPQKTSKPKKRRKG